MRLVNPVKALLNELGMLLKMQVPDVGWPIALGFLTGHGRQDLLSGQALGKG